MDILNWVYLIKKKLTRTTVQDPQKDLVILGGDVTYAKRGDKYQSYGMTVTDFTNYLAGEIPPAPPVVDSEGNTIIANSSDNTVVVGPGGEHSIPVFSGMLLVNDHYDGGVELWIAGGGDTIPIAATNTGGGPVGSTLTLDGNGYLWTNASNMQGPFTFTVIKTRNGS